MRQFTPVLNLILTICLLFGSFSLEADAAPVANARIVINVPSRTLWLYSGDQVVQYYPVGVGKFDFPTPLGQYRVIRKVVNPEFENPFKPAGNGSRKSKGVGPLGTRWIGFMSTRDGEFGIHGTNAPDSVGKFSSHGCVRMKIQDSEALFNSVDLDTPVTIIYDTVLAMAEGDKINLLTYADSFNRGIPTADEIEGRILQQYPNAQLDFNTLEQVLKNPSEKPIQVGTLLPSLNTASLSVIGRIVPLNDMPVLTTEPLNLGR